MNRRTSSSLRAAAGAAVESLEGRRLFAFDPAGPYFGAVAGDQFGAALATSGNLALITAATAQAGNGVGGAVHLVDTTTGATLQVFSNPESHPNDQFGAAATFIGNKIAISDPANVDSLEHGKVFIWDDANDTAPSTILSQYSNAGGLTAFGNTLASDGIDLFVSETFAPTPGTQDGRVYRYDGATGNLLTEYAIPEPSEAAPTALLGYRLAVSDNAVYAAYFDASNSTDVAIFDKATGAVLETLESSASGFGTSLNAMPNGDVYVGALDEVYKFSTSGALLDSFTSPTPGMGDGFGWAVDADAQGNVFISAPFALNSVDALPNGAVHVYDSSGTLVDTVTKPAGDRDGEVFDQAEIFGFSLAVLTDGRVIIGDPSDNNVNGIDAGGAWVYQLEVAPPPTNTAPSDAAIAGQSDAVRQQAIAFSGSFVDPDVDDTHTIAWDFGDGNSTSGELNVAHAYQAAGAYTVTLTVTDAAGASTSSNLVVTVTATGVQNGVLYVGGSAGSDSITLTKSSSTGILISGAGDAITYSGSDIVILGGAGDDVVAVSSAVTANLEIHGGDGNDKLSGAAGHDILLGDAGEDIIYGHTGRDLLIGGSGADALYGEVDDDILIAGSTVHDNDSAKLAQIMFTWTSSTLTQDERVAILESDLLSTTALTVINDDEVDTLTGRNGDDWFFVDGCYDVVTDEKKEEDLSFIIA